MRFGCRSGGSPITPHTIRYRLLVGLLGHVHL
jgi:hypothetical protein